MTILHYYLLRIERRCFWEIASFKQIADFGHLQQLHQEETVYYLRFPITSGGNRVFSTFFGWFSQQLQTAQASTLRTKTLRINGQLFGFSYGLLLVISPYLSYGLLLGGIRLTQNQACQE